MYKDELWLTVASADVIAQQTAGFHTACRVEGAAHIFLRARMATRCTEFPLISCSFTDKDNVSGRPPDHGLVNAGEAHQAYVRVAMGADGICCCALQDQYAAWLMNDPQDL